MVAQDHLDVLTDSGTESDGGGGRYKPGVGPGSAIGMHAAELASTARDTGSARGTGDLAAVGSKPHTPSLNEGCGTALPPTQRQNAGAAATRYEHENPAYPKNLRHPTDSGAAAAAVSAAEITSDSDESDADDTSPAGRGVPQPSSSWKKKTRRSGGILPAAKGFSGYNPDDYEQKYPPDNHVLEAMGPNARIWRVYLDEAALRDNDVIEGWRDTTDVLLVFAGLFSAVVTTLVVQSSQSLQPDNSQATVTLLSELIDVQRAVALGKSPDTVPRSQQPSAMEPASSDLWVNGLWFVSLALSLAVALMAMLVKQWIQYYVHPVAGTIQRKVHTAHLRYLGLENWHVPAIIEFLPIVMHLALLLFFIGLVIFIKGLDNGITIWIAVIAGISYLIYLGTNLLPFYDINCPYKTPVGDYIIKIGVFAWMHGQKLKSHFKNWLMYIYKLVLADGLNKKGTAGVSKNKASDQSTVTISWRTLEQESIQPSEEYKLDVKSLFWLYKYSANPTVSDLILQALPGADFFRHDLTVFVWAKDVHDTIKINLEKYWDQKDQKQIEKWLWPWTIIHMTNFSFKFVPWYYDGPIKNYKTGPLDEQLKGFLDCLSYDMDISKISQYISSLKLQASPFTFNLYINIITLYLENQVLYKEDFYQEEIGFIYLCNLTDFIIPNIWKEDDIIKIFHASRNINTRENLTLLNGCANLMFPNEHKCHIHTNFDNAKDIVQVHSILCKILSKYLSEPNFIKYCNQHNQDIFFTLCASICSYSLDINIPALAQMFPLQFIYFIRNIEPISMPTSWFACGIILSSSISALKCLNNVRRHLTSIEGQLLDKKFIQSWFNIFEQALQQNFKLRSLESVLYQDCLSRLLSYILNVNLYNMELISVLCSLDIDILGRIFPFFQMGSTNKCNRSTHDLYMNLKTTYDVILLSANTEHLQEELNYIQKNDNIQLYCRLFMALWKYDIKHDYFKKALIYFDECMVKFISITSENPIWIGFLEQLKSSIEEDTFSKAWFPNDVCVWFNRLRHVANLDSKISDMSVECSGKLMFLEAKNEPSYYDERQAWINRIKQYYQTASHKNEVVSAKRPHGVFRKYFRKTTQPDAESQT